MTPFAIGGLQLNTSGLRDHLYYTFPVYAPGGRTGDYLNSLGPLAKQTRGSRAGLDNE